MLVDNIMTTGATTSEIARVLKKAKTNSVNVLTLCHEMPLKVINNKKNYYQIVLFFGKIKLLFSQKKIKVTHFNLPFFLQFENHAQLQAKVRQFFSRPFLLW